VARVRVAEGRRLGVDASERLVLRVRARLVAAAHKPLAPDEAGAEYRDVLDTIAPDEAVVPVAVAEVLILVPLVRLRQIVLAVAVARVCGEYGRALVEVERDVALEPNREGAVRARGEAHGAAARVGGGVNRAVDGGRVE